MVDAARKFRPLYYPSPALLDRFLEADGRFAVAIHLRLLLPGVDHRADRNTDRCAVAVARKWASGRCRDETWRRALAKVHASLGDDVAAPVFVNSDSNVVTADLIRYLRNHSIDAQGFVYTGSTAASDAALSGAPIDFTEWWFLSRARRILFAGEHAAYSFMLVAQMPRRGPEHRVEAAFIFCPGEVIMGDRTSSFSLRAADLAGVPLEPIQARCEGLSPYQYGRPFQHALKTCVSRNASSIGRAQRPWTRGGRFRDA